MYETFWQLKHKPFEPGGADDAYYPSETHQGTMLKLRYVVENRREAGLLCGPAGIGKTLLIEQLRRHLPDAFQPFVHVVFPRMSGGELLAYVADTLGAPPAAAPGTFDQTVRRIERFLGENHKQDRHAVLAIDEAQFLAESDALDTIRLLLNFQPAGSPALTLLIAGQTILLPAIGRVSSLEERLAIKALMRPFSEAESMGYVNHRLQAAGAKQTIFEQEALEAVHGLSHGVPRAINRLCDLCLLIGYAEEWPSVTAEHVESVSDELVTITPE